MSLSHERPVPVNPDASEAEQAAARKQVEASVDTRKKGKKGLALGLAAVLLAGAGGGYAATRGIKAAPTTPDRSPAASATPNPVEIDATTEPAEFGISAAEFSNNPEALANEYFIQLNDYFVEGANAESAMADRRFEIDEDSYIAEISQPIDEDFADSMFVDGWESNPALVEYIDGVKTVAARVRNIRILTFAGDTTDKKPYERGVAVTNIVSETPLVTSVLWRGYDNRDENNAMEFIDDSADINESKGGNTITWVDEGGELKISDIENYSS